MTEAKVTMVSIGDEGALNTAIKPSLHEIWIDRDLAWLDFNERVLAEALDERTPLLERVKFLAIFTSNLDEFFMKRVAVLRSSPAPDSTELLGEINRKLLPMLRTQASCFSALIPKLAQNGIHLRRWQELTPAQQEEANHFFDAQIFAALTPLIINTAETFPFLSNLSTSLVFSIEDPETTQHMYARVKVPSGLRQWVQLHADASANEFLFVRLHEIIGASLTKLYEGMTVGATSLVRVTRDAEVDTTNNQETSLFEQVKNQIRKRRYEPVVRLEFTKGADPAIKDLLCQHFQLRPEDAYEVSDELDYTSLFELSGLPVTDLINTPWTPVVPSVLQNGHHDIFHVIRSGDLLIHHPYESFDASVEHFVEAAADDPQTVAVKMTVYRVGDDTPFVKSLIKAAEAGKQVACVVELHARFDEERNLHWAAALTQAGAHITFGVKGLKIHSKTALVVRKESDGLRAYAHIGTGNYHVRTARLYADVGLLTCDPALTRDVISLFHYLTGHSHSPDYKTLLVAPTTMRKRFLELIQREIELTKAGRPGRIIAKMNQLEDPELIEALCKASQAGVSIDLIVRGFCCLRPDVPGLTDHIRVRSIIGRFLEHSRIYYFGAGAENPIDGEFYIGSADWMFRNLSKRIEVVCPVRSAEPKQRLWEILEICLRDRRQAWDLGSDGGYSRPQAGNPDGPGSLGTHRELMEQALRLCNQ
ncbi:MAG: polyphosphate kinase 1 [Acidobacteriaceae bacterium]|nr:polyphosphate kinase 1 [Acidobacteriaceae bacterium]